MSIYDDIRQCVERVKARAEELLAALYGEGLSEARQSSRAQADLERAERVLEWLERRTNQEGQE